MDWTDYGPFATTIAIVAALTTSLSFLIVKAVGRLCHWTWLIHDTPLFVIRAGTQALAIGLIALVFLTINNQNYVVFAFGAALSGITMIILLYYFELNRKIHVVRIPITAANGNQATDSKGRRLFETLVVGTESKMLQDAASALRIARKQSGGVSLLDFIGGYGGTSVNNPEAIWDRGYLVAISNRMTMLLIGVVVAGVMALYLAASSIEVATRAGGKTVQSMSLAGLSHETSLLLADCERAG